MLSALHEQAVIPVADPEAFGSVRSAIESAFSPVKVKSFLTSLLRAGLRIRDFELVLRKGLLGAPTANSYDKLANGDQGQIREFYLASLEKVAPELRAKFFKLYAYY
ncbi:MAG TPA: hypothetical protein VGN01_08495 [Acidobacteriaceae bacterium]